MIYLKEGQIPLNFAYNDEIIQEGNSKYQLSFKFPTNNPLWEELVEETLLLADDLHGEQEFIIFEVEKHHAYITVYANQVATLLNNYSITELSVNNASGDRVMRSLVSSIIREHKFTFSSDIANTHSLNLKNVTVANALFKDKHSILGQWGGDLIRDKYDVRLLSNGGSNKEALFMYKKNLKSYQQKKSIKDLRTRIHFTKTINSQKEGEKDKVIAVTVDSPLIGKYKNIYEGNLDVSDQDVVDEATLRKYGEQYFKTTLCDVIEESIEINVVGIPDEPVGIFDTVTIFHEKFNLDVKKKITKYTYAPMSRKLKTIGFGKIQSNLGTTLATMVDNAIEEKAETMLDAFKIQKNLSELLKSDRKGIEDKLVELEEKSKGALEVKKALFETDGTIPDVVKAKILDAVEGDIGRLKTIITEAELIKAIQAKLNYADIKNALIDKAFINQIISDEKFTQQFEDGEVTTQNIFTKLKDSIKSNISKEFVTKDGVRKLVNDLTIDADGIRQITQQESQKVFNTSITGKVQEIVGEVKKNLPTKEELKGKSSYLHKKYSDFADGRNMSDNSTLKYIGIYTGDKQQAPTNASEYSWTKIRGEDGARGRDGNNGVSNYIHRKYSDSSNGANMSDNSNLKYIGIYTGTSSTPPTSASSYLWSKIKGEDGANGTPGTKGADGRTPYFHTAYSNSPTGDRDFSTTNSNDKLYIGTYSDFEVADSNDYRKYKWVKIKGENGRNGNNGQDGVSSYIYRKYSDNANGSPMSDNSNLKYIGIYTGTSATAPTTPSAYTWSKIKGEDGQQGVPGARGSDGRTSYLHTAYSNSATGERDFSTTNSINKEYIGTYTDFEINDSNDYRRYKWVKIKGENGRDGKSINENLLPNSNFNQGFAKWEDKLTNSGLNHSFDHANTHFGRGLHIWGTANADYKGFSSVPFNLIAKQGDKLTLSMDLGKDALTQNAPLKLVIHYIDDKDTILGQEWQTLDLATQNFEVKKYKRISMVFTIQKDIRKCRVMIYATAGQLINFYIDNIKLERGEVASEWSPAYEDLQAHSLTANLRFEGTYINNITNNVKAYLDVFYDGQKITNGFNARIKFKGGILNTWSNFWNANVDNTGLITNLSWGDKEQQYPIALDVIVLITYKDLNAVANVRMENVPDIVEIKEVVKKYKTFESTLEGFTSVVGEINTKVLTKQQNRQNLNSEDVEKTGNDLYFNTKENLVANEYYTILADLDNVPANQQAYIYSASDGGDKKIIQNGLNYWVVKYPSNQTRINLYPLGANTKVKNIRIFKGDFRVKKDDERENLYSSSATDSGDKFIHLNLIKNKINGNVYTVKFDASGYSYGDRWDIYNRIGYNENNLTQILKSKDNEFTFTINDATMADRMYIRMKQVGNTTISNVEIYDVSTEYVKNSQVSKLETSMKQTKDEIDLKVSKDNVINAINISSEGTRIKGDLIADYLYGKTIEGATIQGNSKIQVGVNGYLRPWGDAVQILVPESSGASRGVGIHINGYAQGGTPKGMFIYNDRNFNAGGEKPSVNETLLTVAGTIVGRSYTDANGKYKQGAMVVTPTASSPGQYSIMNIYSGDGYFVYNTAGDIVYVKIAQTSDIRLKKNIRETKVNALDSINKMNFKEFNWRKNDKFEEVGLIAQELQALNENFVSEKEDGLLILNEDSLRIYALKAIQELSTENQQLKSQLKEMNERLQKLEDKINGNL